MISFQRLISSCCDEPVRVYSADEGTGSWECTGCGAACDARPADPAAREGEQGALGRPCRYCLAAYPILFEKGDTSSCEIEHRDEQRIYDLAIAMAKVFQQGEPTDEQVAWFLQDADAIVDDFDPLPEKWRVRKLPYTEGGEFDFRFRLNDVTYVVQSGGHKVKVLPVRLSTLRQWQREADEQARAARAGEQ